MRTFLIDVHIKTIFLHSRFLFKRLFLRLNNLSLPDTEKFCGHFLETGIRNIPARFYINFKLFH